jgi:hypothetical protein
MNHQRCSASCAPTRGTWAARRQWNCAGRSCSVAPAGATCGSANTADGTTVRPPAAGARGVAGCSGQAGLGVGHVLELEVAGQVAERPDPSYVRIHLPDPEPGRLLSSAVKLAHLAGIEEGLRSARVRAGGPWGQGPAASEQRRRRRPGHRRR